MKNNKVTCVGTWTTVIFLLVLTLAVASPVFASHTTGPMGMGDLQSYEHNQIVMAGNSHFIGLGDLRLLEYKNLNIDRSYVGMGDLRIFESTQ
jgi:hypothetical protein